MAGVGRADGSSPVTGGDGASAADGSDAWGSFSNTSQHPSNIRCDTSHRLAKKKKNTPGLATGGVSWNCAGLQNTQRMFGRLRLDQIQLPALLASKTCPSAGLMSKGTILGSIEIETDCTLPSNAPNRQTPTCSV